MNNRREYYYPLMAYTLLLLLVWLFSWFADMAGMFSGAQPGITSLVSSEGIRWAARSAVSSLESVPWGMITLCVAVAGLLHGSGITSLCANLFGKGRLTKNERRALLFSLFALLLYVAAVSLLAVSPWNIMLGVTGHYAGSPLMHGMPVIVFAGVLLLSLVYGFIYGNYRSLLDVAGTVGEVFSFFVPAFMALLPASGIVPCIEYTGLLGYFGCGGDASMPVDDIICMIPFVYVVLLGLLGNDRESL